MQTRIRIPGALHRMAFCALFCAAAGAVHAQTTAFTYQGQLTDAGAPASGSYDLQFGLFDNAMAGTQIGVTKTVSAVSVSEGVFTVPLDFGVNAFPGANRFLEIGVRPAGTGSFTTLLPRQQISSTPYAIRTLSAATADALSSACVGCVQDSQIASVAGSKVSGTIPAASVPGGSDNYIQNRTTQQSSSSFNVSGNGVVGGNLTVAGTLNANVTGNFIQNRTTAQSGANFNITGNGTLGGTLSANKVGIGTTNPTSRLDIAAQDGLRIRGFQPLFTLTDSNASDARSVVQSVGGGLNFFTENDLAGGSPPSMQLQSGSATRLTLRAQDGLNILGFQPFLTLTDSNANSKRSILAGGNGDFGFYPNSFIGGVPAVIIKNSTGNVGIGESDPGVARLVVKDTSIGTAVAGTSTTGSGVFGESTSASGWGVYGRNNAGGYAIYANGNAGQDPGKGGLVKAMLYCNTVGGIADCYNSTKTGVQASTPPCGFTVTHFTDGGYGINLGFPTAHRFFSAVTSRKVANAGDNLNIGAQIETAPDENSINVRTFHADEPNATEDSPFYLVVF